jgi:hypothetical protein
MRYITISIAAVLFFIAACSKDKVESKPSIKVKSLSTNPVPLGGDLSIELEFTDKEGDLQSIFVQKIRVNKRVVPTVRDTFTLNISDFPKKQDGNLQINLFNQNQLISAQSPPTQVGSPTGFESDSLIIRFALKDKASNVSDTVATEVIAVQRMN